jgi:hypothetical protein
MSLAAQQLAVADSSGSSLMRYTALGDHAAEAAIQRHLHRIGARVRTRLGRFGLSHLILFGGYGKGEGGVILKQGRFEPHNNFDLLAVFNAPTGSLLGHGLQRRADALAAELVEELGIGVDLSVMSWGRLGRLPPAVMWYDLRHGHRLILGDDSFLEQMPDFALEELDRHDVMRLFANRGALGLVNRLLLISSPGPKQLRLVQKHLHKAAIGSGDGYLFFNGLYHASYLERLQRMRRAAARNEAPRGLAEAYERAMQFRFHPKYNEVARVELRAANDQLFRLFERVHRQLAQHRPVAAANRGWMPRPSDVIDPDTPLRSINRAPRRAARRLRAMLSSLHRDRHRALTRFNSLHVPLQGILLSTFPAVAYPGASLEARQTAANLLGATGCDVIALTRAYVGLWGLGGDPNLAAALRNHDTDLDQGERQ